MAVQAINPVTGEAFASYEEISAEGVRGIIADTHQAYFRWRATSFRERATLMRNAAEVLRGNAREYARLMAEEMGKPIRDGIAEAQKSATGCDYYAENAERFLAPEPVTTEARKSFVAFSRAGSHAVELPLLAGLPLRGTGAHGQQRGGAETRRQRAGVCSGDRTGLP